MTAFFINMNFNMKNFSGIYSIHSCNTKSNNKVASNGQLFYTIYYFISGFSVSE